MLIKKYENRYIKTYNLNTVKSLWFWMKKPDRKFIKIILENMIQYKTTVLSQLWDKDEKTAREWTRCPLRVKIIFQNTFEM